MPPPTSLLDELSPTCAVEFGAAPGDELWADRMAPGVHAIIVHDAHDAGGRGADLDHRIDLVIDHSGADRAVARDRFAVWFAALEPGGAYVIDGAVDERFVLELALATVTSDVVGRVRTEGSLVVVWRTDEPFHAARFDLVDAYTDPFGLVS